jgi:hypothetical protein
MTASAHEEGEPSRITDGSAKWKEYVDNAATEGCKISYTGFHAPKEQSAAHRPAA